MESCLPEHVDGVVVPDGHDENHSALESVTHGSKTTAVIEGVGVTESGLLGGAEVFGNRVNRGDTIDSSDRVLDDFAVLDVEAADLNKVASGGVVGGDELGNDGERRVGVDGEAGAVEAGVAQAVGVEVAAILVADTVVALIAISTLGTCARRLSGDSASVRGVCRGDRVGLPNIHLRAAAAHGTGSGVDIVVGRHPAIGVGLEKL